jgi:hypothetical protein
MNKYFEIIIGLVLLVIPIIVSFGVFGTPTWGFGEAALVVLKGGIVWGLILLGLLFLILGISDLKD